ncbi:hypothetical protein CC80DRAFT_578239 [Byssothecium circinans]|uniref:Rhodopsin domain-containing protein n=1 Tax=Byssothecium circinans TaxID=147558 RepID=A0A6A5TFD0_9PLEO|nr:hypothetical protein CC80DRAFT_578239 [Byssothecium circinans]
MQHPTPAQIAYMRAHIDDDRRPLLIGTNVSFILIAVVAVVMRFWARKKIMARLGIDDWLIAGAGVAIVFHGSFVLSTLEYGMGRHVILATNPRMMTISNLVAMAFYNICLTLTKLSILALYARMFCRANGWLNPALWGLGIFVLLLGIVQPFVYIFQCVPIYSLWREMPVGEKAVCLNFSLAIVIFGGIHIATDWMLLLLPIPVILSLQLDKRTKVTICSLFLIGGTVCIISIVRLMFAKVVDNLDPSWDNVPIGALSTVEGSTGILAACMPTWRPLFRFLGRGLTSYFSSGNKSQKNSHNLSYGGHSSNGYGGHSSNGHPGATLSAGGGGKRNRSRSRSRGTSSGGLRVPDASEKYSSSPLPSPSRSTRVSWKPSKRNGSNASGDSVEKMLQGRLHDHDDGTSGADIELVETKSLSPSPAPSPAPSPRPLIATPDPVAGRPAVRSRGRGSNEEDAFAGYTNSTPNDTKFTARAGADRWGGMMQQQRLKNSSPSVSVSVSVSASASGQQYDKFGEVVYGGSATAQREKDEVARREGLTGWGTYRGEGIMVTKTVSSVDEGR